VAPAWVPGLKLSLTYYSIDYEGQIAQPGSADPFNISLRKTSGQPSSPVAPLGIRLTGSATVLIFRFAVRLLLSSPLRSSTCGWQSGVDQSERSRLDVHQSLDSSIGKFHFGLNGSYVFRFDQAVTNTSPSTNILNTVGNPLALRLRATPSGAGASRMSLDRD